MKTEITFASSLWMLKRITQPVLYASQWCVSLEGNLESVLNSVVLDQSAGKQWKVSFRRKYIKIICTGGMGQCACGQLVFLQKKKAVSVRHFAFTEKVTVTKTAA